MSQFCEACLWCKDGKTCSSIGLRIVFIHDQKVINDLCFRSKYGNNAIIEDYIKEEGLKNDPANHLP